MNNDPTRPNRFMEFFDSQPSQPDAQQGPFVGQVQDTGDMSNLSGDQNPNNNSGDKNNSSIVRRIGAAILVGSLAIGAGLYMHRNGNDDKTNADNTELSLDNDTTITEEVAVCGDTWAIHELDNTGHRVKSTGIQSIKTAETPEEARAAADDYLETIKGDPDVLVSDAKVFLGEDVNRDSLVDMSGCMTHEAEQLVYSLATAFAESTITADQAPADGINSGVNNQGEVVQAEKPGITGDRKAIKIVLSDGKEIWILYRCGNKVIKERVLKTGPTDEDKDHGTTTTTTEPGKNPKHDDGRLPGNPDVPADQDKGTPDKPGVGPAGQTPDSDGYLPTETRPQAPPTTKKPEEVPQSPTTTGRPPATTTPAPTSTNPPAPATTTVTTTKPQDGPRPTQP